MLEPYLFLLVRHAGLPCPCLSWDCICYLWSYLYSSLCIYIYALLWVTCLVSSVLASLIRPGTLGRCYNLIMRLYNRHINQRLTEHNLAC